MHRQQTALPSLSKDLHCQTRASDEGAMWGLESWMGCGWLGDLDRWHLERHDKLRWTIKASQVRRGTLNVEHASSTLSWNGWLDGGFGTVCSAESKDETEGLSMSNMWSSSAIPLLSAQQSRTTLQMGRRVVTTMTFIVMLPPFNALWVYTQCSCNLIN